jgi:chemotaxis protein histidine kinase CheA
MEHHEVVPYRDEVLPLVRLRDKFGFASEPVGQLASEQANRPTGQQANRQTGQPANRIPVVVVEVGYKKAGFIVDELVGQQEVVIKSLTGDLKGMRGTAGATIMGDGRVVMIVDVPSII